MALSSGAGARALRGTADAEQALSNAPEPGDGASEEEEEEGNALQEILDTPYANKPFWLLDLSAVTALGCVMGAISYPYSLVTDKVHEWWLEQSGPEGLWDDPATLGWKGGSPSWIWIACVCCGAVGVLKVLMGLDKYPSFVQELKSQHVEPIVSAKVLVGCVASLCAGATLGLEAGLGATGAAMGHLTAQVVSRFDPETADASPEDEAVDFRRRTYILSGIAAGFGAILPAPFIAVLLTLEVASAGTEQVGGAPRRSEFMPGRRLSMKTLAFLIFAATFSYVVRYLFEPKQLNAKLGAAVPYDNTSALYAVPLGLIAGVTGVFFLIVQALTKVIVMRLHRVIERFLGKSARQIIMALFAGVVTGVGIYLFPLAYSSGRSSMLLTIKHRKALSTEVLLGTMLTKSITFWVGMHCGLVGGLFFPLMYVGLLSGEVSARVLGINDQIAVPVMIAAVPGALVTAPMTMLALPVGMFVMGPLNSVPVFIGLATSNTLVVGSGFLQRLMTRRR